MSNPRQQLIDAFTLLRGPLGLGVGELLAAIEALEGRWDAEGRHKPREIARMLWCHSRLEPPEFIAVWDRISRAMPSAKVPSGPGLAAPPATVPTPPPVPTPVPPAPPTPASDATSPVPEPSIVPLRLPSAPIPSSERYALQTYGPVSRRSMVYSWRYLQRPMPDGPADVLDVDATVDQAARSGFFFGPVYRRRMHNHAHLLLLIDQGGSMTPFHMYTRELIETVRDESTIEQIDCLYFQNVPTTTLARDPYLTDRVPLEQALEKCSSDTSVLIVSDAGAARKHRVPERARATAQFLYQVKQNTNLIAWLNPMPESRWAGTTARIIAYMVPMFQMDDDGLSGAIDALRGQVTQRAM